MPGEIPHPKLPLFPIQFSSGLLSRKNEWLKENSSDKGRHFEWQLELHCVNLFLVKINQKLMDILELFNTSD